MNTRRTPFRRPSCRAMTLAEALVVTFIIAVLVGLLLPALRPPRAKAKPHRVNCAAQLKEVGVAFRLYSSDHGDKFLTARLTNLAATSDWSAAVLVVWRSMSNELYHPKLLACPADVRRSASNFATLQIRNTSYFISLEADETTPQVLLAGDRNLTTNGVAVKPGLLAISSNAVLGFTKQMHADAGNILLSDGSVQQVNPQWLQSQLLSAGLATNRLVIP